MRPKMGMLNFGNDAAGNALYLADADEDTYGYYPVGNDANGNVVYSDNPSASPTAAGTGGGLLDFLNAASSIYSTKTLSDINAERAKQGLTPVTKTQATAMAAKPAIPPLLIVGAAAAMIFFLVKKR